ncbi:hypothetical protein BV22DRAFT_1035800 [Leucogyrophana mollusca]|uniref:Uncharacterized protein n=1 Tax=Leucogyrophana mollusca TaxID=85980 RepID=A0ACB8BEL1_9AGAM|nr:hypothetical protein BV22DRAFT_1035800 [Leucogyrophana mollusca]
MDTQTPFTPNSRPQSPSQNKSDSSLSALPPDPPPSLPPEPPVAVSLPAQPVAPTSDIQPPQQNTLTETAEAIPPALPNIISSDSPSAAARLSSQPPSPRMSSRTPKPATPRPRTAEEGEGAAFTGPGVHKPSEMPRPLNVTDALSYLDAVKVQFQDKPDVYNHFLDIMKDFKSEVIDTPGVIDRVSMLFHGNPYLIQGFNTFLPPGYRIEMSADPRDPNVITVTTPLGTTTQSTNNPDSFSRMTREGGGANRGSHSLANGSGHPSQPMSRSITPFQHSLTQPSFESFSPGFQVPSTTAAASFLGNLSNRNAVDNKSAGEFNHAIQYLNKIKARYSDDPDIYKQFLEILQTYQKEQKHLHDSQVYVQVQVLFKDAPDLLSEFKDFLPEVSLALSGPSGVVGILPQPGPNMSAPWATDVHGQGALEKGAKKPAASAKKRRKAPEKDTTPVPSGRNGGSRAKKAKHNHKATEPDSPGYSPYALPPPSPPHVHPSALSQLHTIIPTPSQSHMSHVHGAQSIAGSSHLPGHTTPDELIFFDRAKKTLESRETYEEFLKLLNLYSKDIIDTKTLVSMAQVFLGDGDLLSQFKDVVGIDEKKDNVEYGPPGSIRTGPPEALSALPADDGEGPSYRRLPESEVYLACSGRDELCRSVLNNQWVSHPTWASEEAGFIAHKKNSFEEALHKSEEERHEYHVQLEALGRTIAVLEPVNARIEEMPNEDRAAFRLKSDFGGSSKSIYHRMIKKIYGRDAGSEVIQALQECPSVAVPVVLVRLKQKDDEWRRYQREWNRTWREVDAKNFYKSLDHQGAAFKGNDKKSITAKHFVGNIELIKADQEQNRAQLTRPLFTTGSLGPQLEFSFQEISVLHDSLKLVFSFLDHSQAQYSTQERRAIESWLRTFMPMLCMYPAVEFDAACGPVVAAQDEDMDHDVLDGPHGGGRSVQSTAIGTGDVRKQLSRIGRDKTSGSNARESPPATGSRPSSLPPCVDQSDEPPVDKKMGKDTRTGNQSSDIWIHESASNQTLDNFIDDASRQRPFFANTTFYTMLCLTQLLYSRLLVCRDVGARQTAKNLNPLHVNPIAVELGLDDPNGPCAVLALAKEALGDPPSSDETKLTYMYLLDACEKVFDNELDQGVFEEHMRWFFGNKAYHLFTLDKLIAALVKQIQTILSDNKCQELWSLLQQTRKAQSMSNQDTIRYRREAERHVGSDEHLYRIEWQRQSKTMYIQLVDTDDPSVDGNGSTTCRWREYIDSFVLRQPTEWLPQQRKKARSMLFLRKHIAADESPPSAEECNGMRIRISPGTYKLVYEAESEDVYVQIRNGEEETALRERARLRHEERKRCRWLQG